MKENRKRNLGGLLVTMFIPGIGDHGGDGPGKDINMESFREQIEKTFFGREADKRDSAARHNDTVSHCPTKPKSTIYISC